LKDAIRNVEIKIFRADLRLTTGQVVTHYFTNRLEIGHTFSKGGGSVYEKLACLRNIFNATSRQRCESAGADQEFVDGISQLNEELKSADGSQQKGANGPSQKGSGNAGELLPAVKRFQGCIRCRMSVTRMEHARAEQSEREQPPQVDAHLAYLKLINVPTMFDVGCTQANPQTE